MGKNKENTKFKKKIIVFTSLDNLSFNVTKITIIGKIIKNKNNIG
jgi:hypothetical protein